MFVSSFRFQEDPAGGDACAPGQFAAGEMPAPRWTPAHSDKNPPLTEVGTSKRTFISCSGVRTTQYTTGYAGGEQCTLQLSIGRYEVCRIDTDE